MEDERDQVDEHFFTYEGPRAMTKHGVFAGRNMQYGYQRTVGDDGQLLSRKEKKLRELEGGEGCGKKHFKGKGKK